MDNDLLIFLAKRVWAFYYPIIALLWIFGPLSFGWFLILCVVGAFVSGTVWQIARGAHKRDRSLPPPDRP